MHPSHPTPDLPAEAHSYISVDIETAGPLPSQYAILSIGACRVTDTSRAFYAELQPTSPNFQAEALAVSGLSMDRLAGEGLPPEEAMRRFAAWLGSELNGRPPVFVAFNAAFDWMFISEYFHRYLGRNPFGHAALDIKAFYMGLKGVSWSQTGFKHASRGYLDRHELLHHALQDAVDQAVLFRRLLQESESARNSHHPQIPSSQQNEVEK